MIILRLIGAGIFLMTMVGAFFVVVLCFAVWPLGTAAAITLLAGDRR